MPEIPDFDQIAREVANRIYALVDERTDRAWTDTWRDQIAEQLRQVWNARGAADAEAARVRTIAIGAGEVVLLGKGVAQHFDEAIRKLDR